MNTDYDVVVVGAGPAGSTTAEHAARGGARVLVLERKKVVGEPVACGEFMPRTDEVRAIMPKADDLDPLFDMPSSLVSREMELFRIFSPSGRYWDIPFRGYTTDRDRFDQHLASKAQRAGATVLTNALVRSVQGNEVRTADGTYRAPIIVGADGPVSRVAKGLGLPRNREMYPAVTQQAVGEFEPVMEMHFGIAPGAYAWVLPKKDGANVGVGNSPRWAKKKTSDYFQDFVRTRKLQTVGRMTGKFVPSSGPVGRCSTENGMLVGDAAGHVIAVNGGGIPIAMICGRLAGQVAAEHIVQGTPLSRYEELCRQQVHKPLRTAVHTQWLASLFFGSPRRLELSMVMLGERRMGNIIRCRRSFP